MKSEPTPVQDIDPNCCSLEEKISAEVDSHADSDHEEHSHEHDHNHANGSTLRLFLPAIISSILLGSALLLDNYFTPNWFSGWLRIGWYIAAYLPVGLPVLADAYKSIIKGDVFSEFFLMGIATVGAFAIGEYPEAVAVMLFYAVGEVFQSLAVRRAKLNIKTLLDQRPDEVTILEGNQPRTIKAKDAKIGDILQLKPGEKLGLDSQLLSETASFNTAALTGESVPQTKTKGETVLAGMINLNAASQVEVIAHYTESKLSKVLALVQHATTQKAPTELFIRKFAKVYTPIVVLLSVLIVGLPYFFTDNYDFSQWLYRALVFLVISCPCALVIAIPLGYFGGIGAASKHGILVKGGNFLDALASTQHVVLDKTGTLTAGVFEVQEVHFKPNFNRDEILQLVNTLESHSTHPIATAIHQFVGEVDHELVLEEVEEIPGHGLRGIAQGKELLAGNFKLMQKYGIAYDFDPNQIAQTVIAIAFDKQFVGYLTIADTIKPDAALAIQQLKALGVKTTLLSGDKTNVVKEVAAQLGIAQAMGDLLPENKVERFSSIKSEKNTVAFVGDGINDAPVIALSDVGIAMGGLGSDATIETADVVIQDDKPSKIPTAIKIGRQTKRIVWQNVLLAFAVKAAVLLLGAGGIATMWEAVFADVGVALLAILNAVRIQQMKF